MQTPYRDLSSEEILSAHINGVQSDIRKIQSVLNMRTDSEDGHTLNAVSDQDDPSLRYRIYEGSQRNWTNEPTIYRNGSVVDTSEYSMSAPHGVIVFSSAQQTDATITADIEYITDESQVLDDLKEKIEDIEENTGGDNSPAESGGFAPYVLPPDTYISHYKMDYSVWDSSGNYDRESHVPAFGIMVYGGTIDAFPLVIPHKVKLSQAFASMRSANDDVAETRIGVYTDKYGRPDKLVFQSPIITFDGNEGGSEHVDIDEELEAGFYWIARFDGSTSHYNGLTQESCFEIKRFNASSFLRNLAERPQPHAVNGGYRAVNISFGDFPTTYPSSGELFRRNEYASPFLVVGE